MKTTTLSKLSLALLLSFTVACGGSDGDPDPDPVGGLTTPAMVTMDAGIGTTTLFARLCQNPMIGGGVAFGLVGNSTGSCPGGSEYAEFRRNDAMEYAATLGVVLGQDGSSETAVVLQSASHGTVNGLDITLIPADTAVTVETATRTMVFTFAGADLTITTFTAK
jgi:hypothetical protein